MAWKGWESYSTWVLLASCWVADELRVQDAKEGKVGKVTK